MNEPMDTKDKDPSIDSLTEDFRHISEVYEAIKAVPLRRRDAVVEFVIRRLGHEREGWMEIEKLSAMRQEQMRMNQMDAQRLRG